LLPDESVDETAKTFCAVNALKEVSAISVFIVPEHAPVLVSQLPPVQESTVTVRAFEVAGATPSVINVDVPVEATDKLNSRELRVPLLVKVTYRLTTSPGARFEIGCVKPLPLLADESTRVPVESS